MKEIYCNSNGEPIRISHFPGWTRYNYAAKMRSFERSKTNIPDNVTLITCMDDDSVAADKSPLIRQLTNNNIPFINAAEHKDVYPWVNNKKLQLINDALKKVKTEYCLILDGIDVTINQDLSDIVDLYKTYNKDIIFNATPWAHPHVEIDVIENRKELYGRYCYLNAGCCIGTTKALKAFYKECLDIFKACPEDDEFYSSEQYHVRKAFANNMDKVWFDYDCRIFQVWHKTEFDLPYLDKDGNIIYKVKKGSWGKRILLNQTLLVTD